MKKSNLATALDDIIDKAIQQREAVESKLRIALRGHPDSELWGDSGLIAATMRCVDAHDEAIEQRDEWKAKYIQQNLDLGRELMDPNGTIWDHANKLERELTAMTEQRDEALKEMEQLKQKPCEFCRELPQTENEKAYWQEFNNTLGQLPSMDEWLQNKTPTQTEPE
jgi:hypothetical protein